jgi:hypothetical protein
LSRCEQAKATDTSVFYAAPSGYNRYNRCETPGFPDRPGASRAGDAGEQAASGAPKHSHTQKIKTNAAWMPFSKRPPFVLQGWQMRNTLMG